MDKASFTTKPTTSITIGTGDWFIKIGTVFFVTRKKPNLFARFFLRTFFGIKIISNDERNRIIDKWGEEQLDEGQ